MLCFPRAEEPSPRTMNPLSQSSIPSLRLLRRGKVRDLYAIDARHILIVATDRLSAFDVVLPTPVAGKGAVLTALSNFWFRRFAAITPNHLGGPPLTEVLPQRGLREALRERVVVAKKARPLPLEAVVRGYLSGSGWRDYRRDGAVCGVRLPAGLRPAERLPKPIYTPSTKAVVGGHDANITFADTVEFIGPDLAEQVRALSLRLYAAAAEYASQKGIIIADTKFEFGLDENGGLMLIDELLTPDSSRFWPAAAWRPGAQPPSFDKQFARDYLHAIGWDKTPPAPPLPAAVAARVAEQYREAQKRLLPPAASRQRLSG